MPLTLVMLSLRLRPQRFEEMGFDMLKVIRSLKLDVTNNTAVLPDDYVDWSKVGVVGTDGVVYVLGENKNLNISQKYSKVGGNTYDSDGDGLLDREDDKTASSGNANGDSVSEGFNSYLFRNYIYDGQKEGSTVLEEATTKEVQDQHGSEPSGAQVQQQLLSARHGVRR